MQNLPTTPTFPKPFASNQDDRNTGDIPASGSTEINWTNGFPEIFQKLIGDGGKYVQRKDMNTILYVLSNALCYLQQGGIVSWNSTLSSLITGYPINARVWWHDGTQWNIIESQVGNNQIAPSSITVDNKTDASGNSNPSGTIKWKRVLLMQPEKCLPLSGGTMTGPINWFSTALTSPSSGALQWGGVNIVRSVNGVYAGADGSANIFPDYSTKQQINSGWTASAPGWIYANGWRATEHSTKLFVNGIEISWSYWHTYSDNEERETSGQQFFPVSKNDVVSWEGTWKVYFFNCKS